MNARAGQCVIATVARMGKPAGIRSMVTKAPNRAAVHGLRLPVTDTLEKDEVEKELQKRKQEKQKKIEQVEKMVDSQLNNSSAKFISLISPPR